MAFTYGRNGNPARNDERAKVPPYSERWRHANPRFDGHAELRRGVASIRAEGGLSAWLKARGYPSCFHSLEIKLGLEPITDPNKGVSQVDWYNKNSGRDLIR